MQYLLLSFTDTLRKWISVKRAGVGVVAGLLWLKIGTIGWVL